MPVIKKGSVDIRYSLRPKRLSFYVGNIVLHFLTYTKDKSTEIAASSVNFESFLEDVTLYSKYRCYKNFYLQDVIFQKMSHETHSQRTVLVNTACNLHKIF